MAAPPSPVPPSTGQKLIAEALGTAFLVYVGAGSAAAIFLTLGQTAAVAADGEVTAYNRSWALSNSEYCLPGEESSPEPTVSGVTS